MATRVRRHPFRTRNGELEKWCPGCERWLNTRLHFSRRKRDSPGRKAGEFLSRCKNCICRPRVHHNEVSGYTPVLSCWWVFDEITQRVGQARCAQELGCSPETIRSILYKRSRNVQRRHVYRAITYLRCLRATDVRDAPRVGKRLGYQKRCSGCGTELDNYTDDCETCWVRKAKRSVRSLKAKEEVMEITRAQIVTLFNLTMNMPLDTTVNIKDVDNYGHLTAEFSSDSHGATVSLKVFAGGGSGDLAA